MDYKEIQRLRTRSTVFIVLELLENISVDDLISDLFVSTKDEESMKLIKEYEKIILRGKMVKNFLRDNLNIFYRDMSKYLKKNNLYETFAEFTYFIYSNLSNENAPIDDRDALNIYQNILLQQYEYLSPSGEIVYGVTTDGKLMTKKQLMPCSDYPAYEAEKNRITDSEKVAKLFRKYGYTDEMIENMEMVVKDDGLIENMTIAMISFINENTEDIVPSKYMLPSKSTGICDILIFKNIEEIKDELKVRKYMLPSTGILGKYENAGDIDSVFFKEIFKEDKMYLLYKIVNKKNEGTYGVYDLKDDFFYSIYRDTSIESKTHKNIEKFILKNYSMLTTDSEKTEDLIQVNDLGEAIGEYLFQPIVEFLFEEPVKSNSHKKYRKFNKKNYIESSVSINPYIRKLPTGAVASEEAIMKAKSFGYQLDSDETFVSPFTRATFRKKI